MSLPKMRTIKEIKTAFAEAGERCISERELRRLAKSGAIPCVMAGNRLLINFDALLDFLSTNTIQPKPQPITGGIRRVV